jgi:hypothetical protein
MIRSQRGLASSPEPGAKVVAGDLAAVALHLEVSEQTYHRWRHQYGGMKADDTKRLRELEKENSTSKRLLADAEVEKAALEGDRQGKLVIPSRRRQTVHMLCDRLGLSQRRACQIVGQHRSTQRHIPAEPEADRDCYACNRKKMQRLWREEGLRRVEPHWLHNLTDQAQQRASVALAVLRPRHRVEQALPLRVARLARIRADLQHRDDVGDLMAAHGLAQPRQTISTVEAANAGGGFGPVTR